MDLTPAGQGREGFAIDEAFDAPPIVRFDERRMHVRAYNYWASLLSDRTLPSIEDLNPSDILDFGSHSVLLDFTGGIDDPSIAFLGTALGAQCDIGGPVTRVSEIPPRTLLSRLTDHYLQIIANAAPISFEAEFTNQRGVDILYRGIMMPFSSDDDTIDFVYGVINWKEVAEADLAESLSAEVEASLQIPRGPAIAKALWDKGLEIGDADEDEDGPAIFDLSLDMVAQEPSDHDAPAASEGLDPAEALADHLAVARDAAAYATASEGRTRQALYRAIGLAHAFALLASARPRDYAELLEDAGIVARPKHETVALAKLIFGVGYDKTRIAEFARAIDHARAEGIAAGALAAHLLALPGGLKAFVAAARVKDRGGKPATPSNALVRARKRLAARAAIAPEAVQTDEAGFGVAIVRREADGSLIFIDSLAGDDPLAARIFSASTRKG